MGGLRVKFAKIYEWFDGCEIKNYIKIKEKQDYQIVLYFKNYHYISLIYHRKNMKMHKWK